MIIDSVMKTDMAGHFQMSADFKKMTDEFLEKNWHFDKSNLVERTNLISVIVHTVDIGSST